MRKRAGPAAPATSGDFVRLRRPQIVRGPAATRRRPPRSTGRRGEGVWRSAVRLLAALPPRGLSEPLLGWRRRLHGVRDSSGRPIGGWTSPLLPRSEVEEPAAPEGRPLFAALLPQGHLRVALHIRIAALLLEIRGRAAS